MRLVREYLLALFFGNLLPIVLLGQSLVGAPHNWTGESD
jgi:hypothetical protein